MNELKAEFRTLFFRGGYVTVLQDSNQQQCQIAEPGRIVVRVAAVGRGGRKLMGGSGSNCVTPRPSKIEV